MNELYKREHINDLRKFTEIKFEEELNNWKEIRNTDLDEKKVFEEA